MSTATSPFWLGKARARRGKTLRKSSWLNLTHTGLIKCTRNFTECILSDGCKSLRQVELQQEGRWAVSRCRVCRRLLPHHELPSHSPTFHWADGATGNLPFSWPQSLLQLMEKHICITSFVVNNTKCFQSWEYALSSADTPVRAKERGESEGTGRAWTLYFLACSCLVIWKRLV